MFVKIGTTTNLGKFLEEWQQQEQSSPSYPAITTQAQMDNANAGATKVFGLKGFNFTNPPIITGGNTSLIAIPAFTHSTANEGKETDHYFFHPDHLGSSNYITNFVGEVTQHSEYFAFGETFIEEHKNSHNSPYKFNGKELDEESGLYYYGARYYDPRISIWASVDPLMEQTMTPYQYVNQNPINLIDPTGMSDEDPGKWYRISSGKDVTYKYSSTPIKGGTEISGHRYATRTNDDRVDIDLNSNGTFNLSDANNNVQNGSKGWSNIAMRDGGTLNIEAVNFGGGSGASSSTSSSNNVTVNGFNISKSVAFMNANAKPKSIGRCALYVRKGLNEGGLTNLSGHAYQYYKSGKLENKGFKVVSTDISNFTPQKGDISVFAQTGGRKWGHIAMYNGTQRVSDFKQKSFYVHTDYIKSQKYVIYRITVK